MISRLSAIVIAVSLSLGAMSAAQTKTRGEALLVTPNSAQLYRLLDQVWNLAVDQVEQEKAIAVLRKAVKADPNFAIAHEILAQASFDPAERVSEQKKAFATESHASAADRY
ncbi:MAG: hypothetical protein ABJA69_09990 [Acidobacteriaceae bacterium]